MKNLLDRAKELITGTHLADSYTLFQMQDIIEELIQKIEEYEKHMVNIKTEPPNPGR